MGEVTHTPGPWTAHDLAGTPVNDPSVMSEKHCVATVWINDISRKQAGANARLTAAAPELLAALREMLSDYEEAYGGQLDDEPTVMRQARAALAKAEGRS